jgi:hypothetical protein
MSTEWLEEGSRTNSAVCASGQKIYTASGKKWLETVTDPHGLTYVWKNKKRKKKKMMMILMMMMMTTATATTMTTTYPRLKLSSLSPL